MITPLPTYEQVLELPAFKTQTVPEEYIDENGHMNIGRYLEVASWALWDATGEIGMGQTYIDERGLSTFTAEHHLTYFSELLLGEEFSAHVRLIERSNKAIHSVVVLVDRGRQKVAFTCEATLVHVNMETRRPQDLPDDIAAGLDGLIATHNAVSWPPPVCGAMGVRRSA